MTVSALGASLTLAQLDADPHPVLAALRECEPVAWVQALEGWLVTGYEAAVAVMRDAETFTVQDERFSTSQVTGPSMLSLDGVEHDRHRAPFAGPLRPRAVRERFSAAVQTECDRLLDGLTPAGGCELRGEFAGPLAAGVLTRALGLDPEESAAVREWYEAIVAAVTAITAGAPLPPDGAHAYAELSNRLRAVLDRGEVEALLPVAARHADAQGKRLGESALVANAAVLLFGGIDTTEGMIANAVLHLLREPGLLGELRAHPERVELLLEESLRLEPAAAVIDRYATREVELGGAAISAGELVRVSIAAAGRDPVVFPDPDRLWLERPRSRPHLAFAQGPHVCVGVHLARLEARTALTQILERFPTLRLDPGHRPRVTGLVFRKPDRLWVRWD